MIKIAVFFVSSVILSLSGDVCVADMMLNHSNKELKYIKILDQKQLFFKEIDGVSVSELSDIAYDSGSGIVYFVGDEGALFSFRIALSDTIETLVPLHAVKLKTKKGKKLRHGKKDSEGATMDNQGRLLISFEGKKPKIGWYDKDPKHMGTLLKKYKLPKRLKKRKYYRSRNKALESVAWHKTYGILTAAELPLKKDNIKLQTIYALSGKKWHFMAEPEENSAVAAIEVMDDGNILVLERSYSNILSPFIITLKKVFIKGCKKALCPTQVLLKMDNHKGWAVDNFEGLAKVGKNRYLMVSDDNKNFFQKTLLIYFEVR